MNGTTWLDRTNYFETLPSHQLDLGLWLEADRMATLLDALSQENLDNQREVVKNEKRWSYDNRPYGTIQEKLQGHLYPPEHPYHHTTIGSMDDLDAASVEDVKAFFRTYYAPNNAVLSVVGDVDTAAVVASAKRYFGAHPGEPGHPGLGDLSLPPTLGGEPAKPSMTGSRCPHLRRLPRTGLGDPRLDALESPARSCRAGRAADSTGAWSAKSGSPRTSRSSPWVRGRRLGYRGWATVRPGVPVERVEAAMFEELDAWPRSGQRRRTRPGHRPDQSRRTRALQRVEERADRLSMYATLFDDPGGSWTGCCLGTLAVTPPRAIRDVEQRRVHRQAIGPFLDPLQRAELIGGSAPWPGQARRH